MKDKLFNTKSKRLAALSAFTTLLNHPGWILFVKIFDANAKELERQILAGGNEVPEGMMDAYRRKLEALRECINCPEKQIKDLTPVKAGDQPELDPYPTVDELKEKRGQPRG